MDQDQSAFRHLAFLAEGCGARPAGSEAAGRARSYLAATLRELGLAVETPEIAIALPSLRESRLRVCAGAGWHSVPHKPVWFAGDTGADSLRAELVDAGDGSEAFLAAEQVSGRVIVIARDVYVDYPDDTLYRRLLRHRPAAVLYTTRSGSQGGAPDVYYNFETVRAAPPPPSAVLEYEVALRLLRSGPITAEYLARYEVQETHCAHVVATLQGSDLRDESVVVGAHYDSVPGSPGAADDAGGVAVVLALAEDWARRAASGELPRRTIHFVCWSGHETGVQGSRQFLREHPAFVSRCRFALNFDGIGSRLHVNQLLGCGDHGTLASVVAAVAACGYDWGLAVGPGGLDTINLTAAQIPWVSLGQGLTGWAHTSRDNLESCSPSAFRAPLTAARAILSWATQADQIAQRYPEDLTQACREYAARYGWGLFTDG